MLAHIKLYGVTELGEMLPSAEYFPILTHELPQLLVAYRTKYPNCVRIYMDCAI